MDNTWLMEAAAYFFEEEGEGEDMMESDEEEEEVEQLEEMRPPVLTSWMGPDGVTVDGIMCVDDGIIRLKNRCLLDDCLICCKPSATHGKHQLCCLPCGHMYGLSCIKKWLLQSFSTRKCPQCNTSWTFNDTILLYPPRLCVTDHEKASSSTAFFPFTKQGFSDFKKYESSRAHDVLMLQDHDIRRLRIVLKRARKLEGLAESLETPANPLKPRIDAVKRHASALRRRIDALGQRDYAFESRVIFYIRMYKKDHKKKWLAGRAAANVKEKAEKAAEEKLKERVSVRRRSNRGMGLHSISKAILKRKKSNNYMYYYAAAVLTVPLAVGYTLYA